MHQPDGKSCCACPFAFISMRLQWQFANNYLIIVVICLIKMFLGAFFVVSRFFHSFRKPLVLALGDCIAVRPWSDSPIACLAELRMVWKDKNEQCLFTGLRLYFLPENTPMGRNCHGEVRMHITHENYIYSNMRHFICWSTHPPLCGCMFA